MALSSTSKKKHTALLDLPVDLLHEILDHLDIREVDRLRLVCKAIDSVVVGYQFPIEWECSLIYPTCIGKILLFHGRHRGSCVALQS